MFQIFFFFHQGLRISAPASFCIEDVAQQKDSIHLLFAVDKLKDKLEAIHHESFFQKLPCETFGDGTENDGSDSDG